MTVQTLAASQLPSLNAALADPNTSGFDLVFLAMKALYVANETTLRTKVEEMTEKLEEMDKLTRIQNAMKQAAATGNDQTLETLLSGSEFEGFKVTDIKGADGDVIGRTIDMGNGYTMDVYFADDDSTPQFNELTGTRTWTSTDDKGAEVEKPASYFGLPGAEGKDPKGAVFRAVIKDADGKEVKEIVTYEEQNGIMVTQVFDLENTGEDYDPAVNPGHESGRFDLDSMEDFSEENRNQQIPTFYENQDGEAVKRTASKSYEGDQAFELVFGEGADAVTMEFGVEDGKLSGFGIFKEGEAVGAQVELNVPGQPPTDNDFNLIHGESGEIDAERGTDSDTDQKESYQSLIETSEKHWQELGFTDENGDGSLLDEVKDFLTNELDLELDGGTLTSTDITGIADAAGEKIDRLTSMNQIDMLELEKTFNNLNVIVTAISNIQAGFSRAMTTVANNMA
jgi:hypothetical protein